MTHTSIYYRQVIDPFGGLRMEYSLRTELEPESRMVIRKLQQT